MLVFEPVDHYMVGNVKHDLDGQLKERLEIQKSPCAAGLESCPETGITIQEQNSNRDDYICQMAGCPVQDHDIHLVGPQNPQGISLRLYSLPQEVHAQAGLADAAAGVSLDPADQVGQIPIGRQLHQKVEITMIRCTARSLRAKKAQASGSMSSGHTAYRCPFRIGPFPIRHLQLAPLALVLALPRFP